MSSVTLIGPRQYEYSGQITRGDLRLDEYQSVFNPDVVWSGQSVKVENVNVSFWQAPWTPPAHNVIPPPETHTIVPSDPVQPTPVPEPVQTGCLMLAIGLMVLVRRMR